MSWLSAAKNFVFSHVFAAAARAQSSSSPTTAATGDVAMTALASSAGSAALQAAGQAASDLGAGLQAHKSPAGVVNDVIGDLETGLKTVADAYVAATVGSLPIVGGLIAPEAVKLANVAIDFAEQHALTYVSALFAHHKQAVAVSVGVSAVAAGQTSVVQQEDPPV